MLGELLLVSLACLLGAEGALPPNTGRWVILGGLNGETPSAQVLYSKKVISIHCK
jgi:hypothetical protein